jgi:hypothetical protein
MLSPAQRKWRADKIGDLANIAVGALIFGQFTTGSFHLTIAILALLILGLAFFYSNVLLRHLD